MFGGDLRKLCCVELLVPTLGGVTRPDSEMRGNSQGPRGQPARQSGQHKDR